MLTVPKQCRVLPGGPARLVGPLGLSHSPEPAVSQSVGDSPVCVRSPESDVSRVSLLNKVIIVTNTMQFTSLLLLSLVAGGLAVQTWLEQPSSVFVNPGGDVVLACRINNKQGDCRWERRKDDGQVQPLGFYPGKTEWAGDRATGDCSIRIRDAEFDYDNGKYVCQVTASGFKATDTLISNEAILSVRVPPRSVMLRKDSSPVQKTVSAVAGQEVEVECVVEGGNPSPNLHWYLGRRRLGAATLLEDQRQGSVTSRLRLRVEKESARQSVRCVVEHSALKSDMEASALLDIQCESIFEKQLLFSDQT